MTKLLKDAQTERAKDAAADNSEEFWEPVTDFITFTQSKILGRGMVPLQRENRMLWCITHALLFSYSDAKSPYKTKGGAKKAASKSKKGKAAPKGKKAAEADASAEPEAEAEVEGETEASEAGEESKAASAAAASKSKSAVAATPQAKPKAGGSGGAMDEKHSARKKTGAGAVQQTPARSVDHDTGITWTVGVTPAMHKQPLKEKSKDSSNSPHFIAGVCWPMLNASCGDGCTF
jgi:hypothetical protein